MPLDYRAIGLSPHAEDILIFYLDLALHGVLDDRDRHLLRFLAEGCSVRDIARSTGTSERTAQRHIARVRSRVTAYLYPDLNPEASAA